jgi:glycosyltransferase involved in cell wall biosynthesis
VRVLVHGNAPWLPTGYGQQMAQLVPRLASLGHDVGISAFAGIMGAMSAWEGFPVFPGGLEAYGGDILAGHAKAFRADLVLTLMDAWVLPPDMASRLNFACWMPVDCTPLSALDLQFLRRSCATPIAMSEHGKTELAAAGFSPLYAPHGIDTQVYAPAGKDEARDAFGIPRDAYVIGINAANIDAVRKGFPEQFAAFAQFRARHPEALLLMHSHQTGPGTGMDLGDIIARLGIADAIRWTPAYKYTCGGYTPQEMARWYSALDLLSACAYAEGFGLPVVEAAACGVASAVTRFSAMPQVAGLDGFYAGSEPFFNPRHRAWWGKPRVGEIADAYERAFASPADPGRLREHALAYDADRVFAEYWKPVMDGLAQKTGGGTLERAS